ncbi:MAG TPA: HAMP domain-containing sensor histidine kinase, partial [Methylomirabilota bacterium]|nr:HAMP domain-containing sensor histidine kinase [Methylomirabilota bacterium]
QEIYKHSLELAIVNKTLSLLRKLYQISLLALDPAGLAEKISEPVRVDLNMEAVGVLRFDQTANSLSPYKFSKSDRLREVMSKTGFLFHDLKIADASKNPVLREVVVKQKSVTTYRLSDIWGGVVSESKLSQIAEESHLKTILLYPLVTQHKVLGALFMGLNRDYATLSGFEQDSIKSCIDVIAVALDKAIVYEELAAANQQLKILDQARSEFITIASHQLRTPPATIKWYLASIIAGDFGPIPEEAALQLKKTEWTNNALISLIDDLLNVSRIERGKMEFTFEPTDILAMTQMTVEQLIPQAENKKLKLIFHKPEQPLPQITADKEKLRQVINNFIDNAIKYTKTGQIEVDLSQTDKNITLKVTDTGRGLTPEQSSGIFQKFDRGKTAPKNSTGLGLGLYVAKVIVEQHHGKIWAESKGEGQGSSFIFTIPIHSDLTTSTFDLTQTQKVEK